MAAPLGAGGAPPAPPRSAAELPLPSSAVPSMSQTMRCLKRRDTGLYNRLASIALDAQFVASLHARLPDAPLLANLRCGGWYAPVADGSCQFKSTDGHARNAGFSLTRLNVEALRALATCGAALLIDSTRSGKRHPDAATRTAPLWVAVLNEVRRRLRWKRINLRRGLEGESAGCVDLSRDEATAPPAEGAWAPADPAWRAIPVLPPWAGPSEADALAPCVGEWASAFERLGRRDLEQLLVDMPKPIGCLWLDPGCSLDRFGGGDAEGSRNGGRMEATDEENRREDSDVAGRTSARPSPPRPSFLGSLDFAPLVLVNASLPDGRGRRTVEVARDELARLTSRWCGRESARASGCPDVGGALAAGAAIRPDDDEDGDDAARATTFAFDYVPGGGDDEESWSCGLTPEDAWAHMLELLAAGPDGAPAAARHVVERRRREERRAGGVRVGMEFRGGKADAGEDAEEDCDGMCEEGGKAVDALRGDGDAVRGNVGGGALGGGLDAGGEGPNGALPTTFAPLAPSPPGTGLDDPALRRTASPSALLPSASCSHGVRVMPSRAVDEHHPVASAAVTPGVALPPPEELFPSLWRVPGVPGPLAVGSIRAARELCALGSFQNVSLCVELLAERENAVRRLGADEPFRGFADALDAASRALAARAPTDPPLVLQLPTLRGKRDKQPLREAILLAVTLLHQVGSRGGESRREGSNEVAGGSREGSGEGGTAAGCIEPLSIARRQEPSSPSALPQKRCVVFACPRGDDVSVAAAAAALLAAARGDSRAPPGRPELRKALGRLYAAIPNARPGSDGLKATLAAFVPPFHGNGGGTGTGGVVPAHSWGPGFAL